MAPLTRVLLLMAAAGAMAAPAAAQTALLPPIAARDSVTIVLDSTFAAGGLHRTFFGSHWRKAWGVSVRVPIVVLADLDGGLVPTKRGGGKQTRSLRFRAPSGREYVFRSLAKDPSPLVPQELRGTLITDVLDDQISASHPLAPLVVDRLLDAAAVPHASPQLVQLPRTGLGEFTADFGGMIGYLERRPTDDDAEVFAGEEIEGTYEMLQKLDGDGRHRVDARAFLAARLMDLWLGDWDRHADQWRWARSDSAGWRRWRPIPRDRDQAFSRYDGLLLGIARKLAPQLTVFSETYGSPLGLGWNARFLDRRVLGTLPPSVWDSTARTLSAVLTDDVIDAALARLPADRAIGTDALRAALRARREQLPTIAEQLRRMLTKEAELYGTGRADTLRVVRGPEQLRVLLVSGRGDTLASREYAAGDTKELRVYLGAGADLVQVSGDGPSPRLRIIAGAGADDVQAARSAGVRVYDSDSVAVTPGVAVQRKPWPQTNDWAQSGGTVPPRDWGSLPTGLPFVGFGPDVGFSFGTGFGRTTFGFRKVPSAFRYDGVIGVATGAGAPIASLRLRWQGEQTSRATEWQFLATGAEQLRWFGVGNETVRDSAARYYRAHGITLRSRLLQSYALGRSGRVSFGPEIRWTNTDEAESRLIGQQKPYGFGKLGRIAAMGEVVIDTRDVQSGASKGVRLQLGGSVAPAVWDVVSTYGEVHGEVRTYLTPGRANAPTLALRAGGRAVFGTAPYLDRATVGGVATVRGLREQRFVGKQAVYGSAELRQALGRVRVVVPMRIGLFGFSDAGRVFEPNESSDTWHWGLGGGLWAAIFQRGSTVSLGAARSDDKNTLFYLRAGMAF